MSDEIHSDCNQALVALINAKVAEIEASDAFKGKALESKRPRKIPFMLLMITLAGLLASIIDASINPERSLKIFALLFVLSLFFGLFFALHYIASSPPDAGDETVSDSFLAEVDALREGGHVIDRRILSTIADQITTGKYPTYAEVLRLAKTHKPLSQDAQAFAEKFASNGKAGQWASS